MLPLLRGDERAAAAWQSLGIPTQGGPPDQPWKPFGLKQGCAPGRTVPPSQLQQVWWELRGLWLLQESFGQYFVLGSADVGAGVVRLHQQRGCASWKPGNDDCGDAGEEPAGLSAEVASAAFGKAPAWLCAED